VSALTVARRLLIAQTWQQNVLLRLRAAPSGPAERCEQVRELMVCGIVLQHVHIQLATAADEAANDCRMAEA
jgi:hypothetical protein